MSDAQELISVIVPIYKVEKYLDRCIDSITSQTYKNLEIILVDDGSPDSCPQMCDAFAAGDTRIKVIHKENGGLSDARNAGLKIAAGQYISFIDSDDWIEPEMYERMVRAMNRDKSDIAACSVRMVWEDGSQTQMLIQTPDRVLDRSKAQKALLLEDLLKQPVWYKLYKRECVKNILFDVGRCHEDVYWSYKAVGAAERVSLIAYVGYNYLQRNDSIMGAGYSLKRLDALKAYCRRYEYMKKEFPELADMALKSIWLRCMYDGQKTMLYLPAEERKKAFKIFRSVRRKYPIKYRVYMNDRFSRRVWISLSRISLKAACLVRNTLKIGL